MKLNVELTRAKDETKMCNGTIEYKLRKCRVKYLSEKERCINHKLLKKIHSITELKSEKNGCRGSFL